MGAEQAYPWFEAKWLEQPQGLFKSRTQNQKRLLLAKAVQKAQQPSYFQTVAQKTPLETLSEEIRSIVKTTSAAKDAPHE